MRNKRSKLDFFLFLLISWLCWHGAAGAAHAKKPPNVILILADDMGFDDVSFRGSSEILTPNIDALAYHGKILDRLYAPAICTPSRGALMTGRFPIHTGTQHFVISNEEPWSLPTNVTTMAEIFQRAGYSTHLVGKWHLGFAKKEYTPTYRGFDEHIGYWGGLIDYYQHRAKMPNQNTSLGYDYRRNMQLECSDRGKYATDVFTREAERIITTNNGSQPLFLIVNHLAVHAANDDDPLQAPEEEIAKFRYIKNPQRRKYAAMLSKLDESVGRIVKALERTADMLDNSIIIFYSDNGAPSVGLFANTGSNWPLKGQKNSPWEGGLRVTGAIWSSLLGDRATVFRQTMYVGDWLPTLAEAAGIPLEPELKIDGLSFWPQLTSSGLPSSELEDREIVHYLDDVWQVVSYMKGRWKYVNGSGQNGIYDSVLTYRELYDLDPRSQRYVVEVRNSLVSQALKRYDEKRLSKRRIEDLRAAAAVQCGNSQHGCNALIEECLYDLQLDPCETNNLIHDPKFAHILQMLRGRVQEHRRNAWPLENRKGRIEYDPTRHDCTWTNFLEEAPNENLRECGYHGPPCEDND